MERDHYYFAMWAAAFLAGATGVILYQHACHTRHLTALFGSRAPADEHPPSIDGAALGPLNDNEGRQSRIADGATPLGGPTPGVSPFPYRPAQNQDFAWKPASPMNAYEVGSLYENDAPIARLNG
jgi:hypothetical protein